MRRRAGYDLAAFAARALHWRFVAEEIAGPCALFMRLVVRIVEPAGFERKTTAADAGAKAGPQIRQRSNAFVDGGAETAADFFPVFFCRRTTVGKTRETIADFGKRKAETLSDENERHAANIAAQKHAIATGAAARGNQSALFVKSDCRDRRPCTRGHFTDGNPLSYRHFSSFKIFFNFLLDLKLT